MQSFSCKCGNTIYFDTTKCLQCGQSVAFLMNGGAFHPIIGDVATFGGKKITPCKNAALGLCNWYAEKDEPGLCPSCELSRVIPDLSVGENLAKLARVESAKRRLIANLNSLGLSVWSKDRDATAGLAFEIKAPIGDEKVMTGHDSGVITLNLNEADPVLREKTRCELGENYRTILGHLRHEVGHFFFDRLIVDEGRQEPFRELFGDERADYAEALKKHYDAGPKPNWSENYVSAYAASHPWEDWAETWAHYLHAHAAAETARIYKLGAQQPEVERDTIAFMQGSVERKHFDAFRVYWDSVAVTINELNRSLGVNEPYPFQWSPAVEEKLFFVHRMVRTKRPLARAA